MSETSYGALFFPVIGGILVGAWCSGRIAGRFSLPSQVRFGLSFTFGVALARVVLHFALATVPIPVQQVLLFFAGFGAQFAFPVLTLQMLDLFPAARGTASSAQSFVALLITASTIGIVSPHTQAQLNWLAWASLVYTLLASASWYISRRWHERAAMVAQGAQ